ncbi:MAG: DUF1858 domain-containing protein [Dehalococcoidia bacterium]
MARAGEPAPLGPHTTVREAVQRYPGIHVVFDRHGLHGCGGADGPIEEIAFFARVHQVDPALLLRELNEYASRRAHSVTVPLMEQQPRQITQLYLVAIIVSLTIAILGGFPLGILAALGGGRDVGLGFRWTSIVQAHGHLQMVGFVALFIVGIAYHVLPRFKNTALALPRLGLPSIALLAGGALLRTSAQPWAEVDAVGAFLIISGVLELCGALAFASVAWMTLRGTQRKNYDLYLMAAVSWFVVASLANLVLLSDLTLDGARVIPVSRNAPLLEMYLLGFVTLFILGVSVRILPHFVSLRPPAVAYLTPALLLFNAGLLVRVGSGWIDAYSSWARPEWLQFATVSAMAVAIAAFVFSLNLHRRSVRDEASDIPARHELLIRTAYVWLLVSVGIEAWFAAKGVFGDFHPDFLQDGAARHALALGFVMQMIFGVGSRALPTFAGKRLYSQRLVLVVWLATNAAVVMRVGPALFPWGSATLRFDHIATAGVLGLIALIVFAYNIARTLRPARHRTVARKEPATKPSASSATYQLTPTSVVADVLREVPGSLELLIGYGFKPLADPEMRARVTPHVTLAHACSIHGIEIDALVGALKALQVGTATTPPQQQILAALRELRDPEIPTNIVDLGLVHTISVNDNSTSIELTLTSPDCPAAGQVVADVIERVRATGIDEVEVSLVREPAWDPSRMTPAARQALGWE